MVQLIDLAGTTKRDRTRQNVNQLVQNLIQQKLTDKAYKRRIEREDMKSDLVQKQKDRSLQNKMLQDGYMEVPEGTEGATPLMLNEGVKYYKQQAMSPTDLRMQQIGKTEGGAYYMPYNVQKGRFQGTPQFRENPAMSLNDARRYATGQVEKWKENNPGKKIPAGLFSDFMRQYKRPGEEETYRTASAKEQATLDYVARKTDAKKQAEWQVERKKAMPAMKQKFNEQVRDWDMLEDRITKAIKTVGPFTSSYGSWFKVLPGSDAKTLAEDLKTIAGVISFEKLQKMREASPTGGALGQVSDFENRLLQATRGSLEQSLSPAELKSNLGIILRYLKSLRTDTEKAYYEDYGDLLVNRGTALPTTETQPQPQATPQATPQAGQTGQTERPPLDSFF